MLDVQFRLTPEPEVRASSSVSSESTMSRGSGALWPNSAARPRNTCAVTPAAAGGLESPRPVAQCTRVRCAGTSSSTRVTSRISHRLLLASSIRSCPTISRTSPGFTLLPTPASSSAVSRNCGRQGASAWTGIAFHSTRAAIASTVSKVCGFSSGPGTLCTRVPTGIVTGAAAAAALPGASSSVKARCVPAATPGASS